MILFEPFVDAAREDEEFLQPFSLELDKLTGMATVALAVFRTKRDAEDFRDGFFGVYGPGLEPFELPDEAMGEFLLDMLEKGYAEHITHAVLLPPKGDESEDETRGEPQVEVIEMRAFAQSLREGQEWPVRYA